MTNTNLLDLCRLGLSLYDALMNAEIIGQLTIQVQFAVLWMDPTSNSPPRKCIYLGDVFFHSYLRVSHLTNFLLELHKVSISAMVPT